MKAAFLLIKLPDGRAQAVRVTVNNEEAF